MAWYAKDVRQRTRQIGDDVGMLLWTLFWGFVCWLVYRLIYASAAPARSLARMANEQQQNFQNQAERIAKTPAVGEVVRQPVDQLAQVFDQVGIFADNQVRLVERLAVAGGVLVFVIPVTIWLFRWLPGRIAFARRSAAAQRFIDSAEDLDLFALRAMAVAPMTELAKISDDPVGDWRRGDQQVITKLADLALRREGLAAPKCGSAAHRTQIIASHGE